ALERAQGLPHRGAAHDELLGEVALGRQPVAALEPSFRDHRLHSADDLLVDACGLDRGHVHRSAHCPMSPDASGVPPRHRRHHEVMTGSRKKRISTLTMTPEIGRWKKIASEP